MVFDNVKIVSIIESACDEGLFENAALELAGAFHAAEESDLMLGSEHAPIVQRAISCFVRIGNTIRCKDDLLSEWYIKLWKNYTPFIRRVYRILECNPRLSSESWVSVPQLTIAHGHTIIDNMLTLFADSSCKSFKEADLGAEFEALCSLLTFHVQRLLLQRLHFSLVRSLFYSNEWGGLGVARSDWSRLLSAAVELLRWVY